MTGLWAFEGQMPYQKYQGPPIVVRYVLWRFHKVCKSYKFGQKISIMKTSAQSKSIISRASLANER